MLVLIDTPGLVDGGGMGVRWPGWSFMCRFAQDAPPDVAFFERAMRFHLDRLLCLRTRPTRFPVPFQFSPILPLICLQYPFDVEGVLAWLAEQVDMVFVFLDPIGQVTALLLLIFCCCLSLRGCVCECVGVCARACACHFLWCCDCSLASPLHGRLRALPCGDVRVAHVSALWCDPNLRITTHPESPCGLS